MKPLLSLATLFVAFSISAVSAQEISETVRVFVLAGQSNMQGHAVVDMDHPEHYNGGKGNLNHVLASTGERFAHLKDGDGWTVRDDVMIRFVTRHETKTGGLTTGFAGYQDRRHFGPELQFGHVVGNHFEEPVLLVKTAWGGKSLKTDFRPPSAVAKRGGETGPYYTRMMEEVKQALSSAADEFPQFNDAQFEIGGFVWQQGWNDMIDEEARDEYFQNLVDLVNDVRLAWDKPDLPVVVGELGNGGKDAGKNMKQFRRQQSRIDAHPPFVGNVLFVPTIQHARPADESPNVSHLHHWSGNAESYLLVGDSLGKKMVQLYTSPKEPRILILGDSISMGYTPIVRQAFRNRAFVARPMNSHRGGENCAGTDKGIQSMDRWLSIGGGDWDVIHFNFGLHDLKHVHPETQKNSNDPNHPQQSSPDDYEQQLRQIVDKLKTTNAQLIFATTTPVPEGGVRPFRDPKSPEIYNAIARKVMDENDVSVNDLYSLALENQASIQRPVDVHFTREGSELLGKQVVRKIEKALKTRE